MKGRKGSSCAALAFALILASLICILVVILAGITNHERYMFEIKTSNLSISSSELANLANLLDRRAMPSETIHLDRRIDLTSLGDSASSIVNTVSTMTSTPAVESAIGSVAASLPADLDLASTVQSIVSGDNITASDLGVADSYQVFLWNYCSTSPNSKDNCTDANFNWAAEATNTSTLISTAKSLGVDLTLPKDLTSALKLFSTAHMWTQILYIGAIVLMGINLFYGLSIVPAMLARKCHGRRFPLVGSILSVASSIFICVASGLATAMSKIAIGAVERTAKDYGVTGDVNNSFLATTWLASAFSIGGTLFWLASTCRSDPRSKYEYKRAESTDPRPQSRGSELGHRKAKPSDLDQQGIIDPQAQSSQWSQSYNDKDNDRWIDNGPDQPVVHSPYQPVYGFGDDYDSPRQSPARA